MYIYICQPLQTDSRRKNTVGSEDATGSPEIHPATAWDKSAPMLRIPQAVDFASRYCTLGVAKRWAFWVGIYQFCLGMISWVCRCEALYDEVR